MIIKKDYINREFDYLQEERKGLDKAINKLDERYKNNEIEKDNFYKQLDVFTKRGEDLKKRMDKNSRN